MLALVKKLSNVPLGKYYETLNYNDYYHPVSRESKLIPNLMLEDYDNGILNCPRCNMAMPDIEHATETTCLQCGLYLARFGNALKIW